MTTNIFKYGMLVTARHGSTLEKILNTISDAEETCLMKNPDRPYVIVSCDSYNDNLETILLCPQKSLSTTTNLKNRVVYVDETYTLREVCVRQIITADKKDLVPYHNYRLPDSILQQVSKRLIGNLRYFETGTEMVMDIASPAQESVPTKIVSAKVTTDSNTSKSKSNKKIFTTEQELLEFKADIESLSTQEVLDKYQISYSSFNRYREKVKNMSITPPSSEEYSVPKSNSNKNSNIEKTQKAVYEKLKAAAEYCLEIHAYHTGSSSVERLYKIYRLKNVKEIEKKYKKCQELLEAHSIPTDDLNSLRMVSKKY